MDEEIKLMTAQFAVYPYKRKIGKLLNCLAVRIGIVALGGNSLSM